MKDFRVKVRVQNNRLLQRREELGLTQGDLAKRVPMSWGNYSAFERLSLSPIYIKTGYWRPEARMLADFHGVTCDDLWPDCVLAVQRNSFERSVNATDLALLAVGSPPDPPDLLAEGSELKQILAGAMRGLTERDKLIIEMRFGLNGQEELTLNEIAQKFEVGRERIRQIEGRALRKLRSPSNARSLDDYKPE